MHIYTFFILLITVAKCHACLPTLPEEGVGFPAHFIDQLESLPEPPRIPVIQVFKKELEKINKKLISKTAEIAIVNKPLNEFTTLFAGCRLNKIKFTSPETGNKQQGKTIIPPDLRCAKASKFGCQTAVLSCKVPVNSKYSLISGFAKIDGADWATTDLKSTKTEFHLECDLFNRWTYVSDIPGLVGKVYATNEVFCLLVPIITEHNSLDFLED